MKSNESDNENEKKIGEILVGKGAVKKEDVDSALASQKKLGEILVEKGKADSDDVENVAIDQSKSSRNMWYRHTYFQG